MDRARGPLRSEYVDLRVGRADRRLLDQSRLIRASPGTNHNLLIREIRSNEVARIVPGGGLVVAGCRTCDRAHTPAFCLMPVSTGLPFLGPTLRPAKLLAFVPSIV